MNYYNEFDPFAAEWLRELIKTGLIPNGEVDTRSIVDVRPSELTGYSQCHFFAGIGGWSHALRLAGWPDDRPIWTGSCPCQPFSVAGKGKGKADERHLWPVFHRLIAACRPPVVMGEQVAGKSGYDWFDGVAADLEREGYASRAVDIPACAVNAPHIRQRLYWCAVGNPDRSERQTRDILAVRAETRPECSAQSSLQHGSVDDAMRRRHGDANKEICAGRDRSVDASGVNGPVVNADRAGQREYGRAIAVPSQQPSAQCAGGDAFWSDHEWLTGADGKTRRSKPGVRLLVDGVPNRVGRLRGYGNAIVPPLAAQVIKAFMETEV